MVWTGTQGADTNIQLEPPNDADLGTTQTYPVGYSFIYEHATYGQQRRVYVKHTGADASYEGAIAQETTAGTVGLVKIGADDDSLAGAGAYIGIVAQNHFTWLIVEGQGLGKNTSGGNLNAGVEMVPDNGGGFKAAAVPGVGVIGRTAAAINNTATGTCSYHVRNWWGK